MEPSTIAALVAVAAAAAVVMIRKGRAQQRVVAAWYSASDGYGGYLQEGQLLRYDPDPVALVDAVGPVTCRNRSHNGMRLRELLEGGRLANGLPEIVGDTGVTVLPLREQLAADRPDLAVIGAGMVDWLFDGITPAEYTDLLARAAREARELGIVPVFLGFCRFEQTAFITPAHLARLTLGDATLRQAAAALAVPYIDRSSVAPVMAADGLHQVFEWHLRAAPVMAAQLASIAASRTRGTS